MYERTRVFFETSIEIEEKHTGKYGAPGRKRAKRVKPTPEQVEKQNQWRKERDVRWLLKENFREHDYWLTLTYKRELRPADLQQAKEQVQKFLRKMRDQYKKRGAQFKYVVITEVGSRGGIHHHIVMNRIEGGDILISECWQYGHPAHSLLYQEGGFRKLANYIAKKPNRESAVKEKWYSRSRNLRKPRIKKEVMKRKTFSKDPYVPKGYYLEKESLYSGINIVTGHPYRYYTVIRQDRRSRDVDGKCLC